MRAALLGALLLCGCSLIVPGPGDYTYGDSDAGADAGTGDAGPMTDAGIDGGDTCALTVCGGDCVDTMSDLMHCGMCDNACADGEECRAGSCFDPVVDIAAGPHHTCAVRQSGEVWCWGANINGQLGNDSVFDSNEPVRVMGIDNAVQVSAGGFAFRDPNGTSCAVARNGVVRCWGQVGAMYTETANDDATTPVTIPMPSVREVRVGFGAGCAVSPGNGLICWDSTTMPAETTGLGIGGAWIRDLAFGAQHVCVATVNGDLQCRGMNAAGQLGADPMMVPDLPDFWPVHSSITDVEDVAVSTLGTCISRASGAVECWGAEVAVGNGSTDLMAVEPSPQVVAGVQNVQQIDGTDFGSFTCAVGSMGSSLRCWGLTLSFAMPGGDLELSFGGTPYELEAPPGIEDLAVGTAHVCVLSGGDVSCYGDNSLGQLGDGSNDSRLSFGAVIGLGG